MDVIRVRVHLQGHMSPMDGSFHSFGPVIGPSPYGLIMGAIPIQILVAVGHHTLVYHKLKVDKPVKVW
jgi:hypothetical protein